MERLEKLDGSNLSNTCSLKLGKQEVSNYFTVKVQQAGSEQLSGSKSGCVGDCNQTGMTVSKEKYKTRGVRLTWVLD